jgi:hypothetical protein
MASILQLTDSAYFSCFKTQFHNIVAGEYSTGYIHIESRHVNGKTYLNTYAIFEYLCHKCFPNFCDQPKDKSRVRFVTYIGMRLYHARRNKIWKAYDVHSRTE